jgi:hypothetical protein
MTGEERVTRVCDDEDDERSQARFGFTSMIAWMLSC